MAFHIDAKGDPISKTGNESEEWIFSSLDLDSLNEFRKKFPVALDADQFDIIP